MEGHKVVRIFCRHSNPWPPDGSESFWEIDFVALENSMTTAVVDKITNDDLVFGTTAHKRSD